MPDLFFRLPDPAVALILALAIGLPIWLAPILAARLFGPASAARVAAGLEGVKLLGPLTAVFLSFSLVQSIGQFRRIEVAIGKEATDITQLDRGLLRLSGASVETVRATLRAYAKSVVEDEFPAFNRGRTSPRTAAIFNLLLQEGELLAKTSVAGVESMLIKLDDVDDDRTARLENINIHLPWFFWWVTLLLMLLLLLEAGRLEANSPLSRAIAGYAAALGLLISLLFAVDTPFRGDTSVSSQPFRVAFLSMQPAPIPAPGGGAAPASDRSAPVPIPSSR